MLPARDRILITAHDLFYRDGIRATGIDRIIAESGVAKLRFADPAFRGCAFINAIAELGGGAADTLAIARQHKREMEEVIADLLPEGVMRAALARAVAMAVAVDGAIVRAQMTGAQPALEGLRTLLDALAAGC